uniref:RELT like 2 n=1 Tax=Periophthalmus magnuspinnatus TaxID=409849 RepID=A0A3B4BM05_9GOBI
MSEQEGALQEENPPPYIIFVVVFLFFLTGLCGFLVCHLLKQKGYSCHMGEELEDEDQLEDQDDDDDENQDTVEQILKCIIENEVFQILPVVLVRLRKESIGGVPPHMHTVHSGTDLHNTCHLCAQSRSKRGQRRASRTPRLRARPGEQTVFSVGRFRVTHTGKKNPDSSGRVPDVLVGSGERLDKSQDSDERREAGFDLRNMFKDVRPPSESTNGMAPNVGKRRRSLTFFGMRRGSDPIGVKVVSTGREGVKFIPQPVVLEEPHNDNGENGSKDAYLKKVADPIELRTSVSDVSVIKTRATNTIAVENSMQGTKVIPAALTPAPNSLQMSLKSSPKPPEVVEETDQQVLLSPGPLQTSTPLSPLPDPGEVVSPFTGNLNFPIDLPGTQTPPDPCTSPVLEHDSFASPALISLGSSPHLHSIRTPTSPVAVMPSPKFSRKGSSQPASSPKLSSDQPIGSTLNSLDKSMTSLQTSSPSVSLQDETPEPGLRSSVKTSSQIKLEGSITQQSMEKPELKNLGIVDDGRSSPQLSPSSPLEGRVSNVTIVKASPDSKREFSVATMTEDQAVASSSKVDPGHDGGAVKWTLRDEKEVEAVEEPQVAKTETLQD